MKRFILLTLIATFIFACSKEDEAVKEVNFRLKVSNFLIKTSEFGGLKSAEEMPFDLFNHVFPSGRLVFTNSEGATFTSVTGSNSIENYSITLPIGDYTISGYGGAINTETGSDKMKLTIPEQSISIEDTTTIIPIDVTPECGLILVYDDLSLVTAATIGSGPPNPLWTQGDFYYVYFIPTQDVTVNIVKTGGATLEIDTNTLQTGNIYKVQVTSGGSGMVIGLNVNFIETDPIVW